MTSSPYAAIRSDLPGIAWPPVSNGPAAALAATLRQLEDTQWLAADEIRENQSKQLRILAAHCRQHSPHFRRRLKQAGLNVDDILTPEGLQRLPVMRRRELQSATDLFCTAVPDGHAPLSEARTSGSTGEPVAVMRSQVSSFLWYVYTLRDHIWHRRDFRQPFCAIRADLPAILRSKDWGKPVNLLFESGPGLALPISMDIDAQIDEIRAFGPHDLLTYPSNLGALVSGCAKRGVTFEGLGQIRTIGETLTPSLRKQACRTFGVDVVDCYSSREFGIIALQCPETALYHVMETVILEVLDDEGRPCPEGQAGRVTLTDLHNFATPIIRYQIGDYAEPGPRCACGRGLPTLKRILGRERNLVRLPGGGRHWPIMGMAQFRNIAPIEQFQFVQHDLQNIEVRLVTTRRLTDDEERILRDTIRSALGHAFTLEFLYFEKELPKRPNGKFEEFICELPLD